MGILKKIMTVPREDFYVTHLSIINSLLPVKMTPKEIEVLGIFMAIDTEKTGQSRFGAAGKKIVKDRLKISSGGLGNYLKSLRDKGFIYYTENKDLAFIDILEADPTSQTYLFKIIKEEEAEA